MKDLKGGFIILFFFALGQFLSALCGGFIPGNVLGMLLLFIALCVHLVTLDDVRSVSHHLTKNMAVFFVPASIGVMEQWGIIRANWGGFLVICIFTTFFVLVTVGTVMQVLVRKEIPHE